MERHSRKWEEKKKMKGRGGKSRYQVKPKQLYCQFSIMCQTYRPIENTNVQFKRNICGHMGKKEGKGKEERRMKGRKGRKTEGVEKEVRMERGE